MVQRALSRGPYIHKLVAQFQRFFAQIRWQVDLAFKSTMHMREGGWNGGREEGGEAGKKERRKERRQEGRKEGRKEEWKIRCARI